MYQNTGLGGGIGGLTLYLRKHGFECDHLDIPGNTWEYAKHRFKNAGIEAATKMICSDSESISEIGQSYDMIVALDCLEHLHPLREHVMRMHSALRYGGVLLSKSTFRGKGLHIKSNHQYNNLNIFNMLMNEAGFKFKGLLLRTFGGDILVPAIIVPLMLKCYGRKKISGFKIVHCK